MTTISLPGVHGSLTPSLLSGPADRWRPARLGALRIWQYDDEVIDFASGRVLLFGANGSGKTMLLELTLPYLLDAKGAAGRLSTSGADRGGLWDRVTGYTTGQSRTGYLWAQFTRTSDDGDEHFTVGARLKAKPAGGGEHCWFTTSQRPGEDLFLLGDDRRPLDIPALTEAIGDRGRVWHRDTDGYRGKVRTTLYAGFTPTQMEAMVSTLLTVRKQSVTDGLSPAALNGLLTEGLPALDAREVTKVATGFEDLDSRRDQIAAMAEDVAVVGQLHDAARRYARVIIEREAARVRSSETKRDDVTKRERKARGSEQTAREKRAALGAEDTRLEERERNIEGRMTGLRASEAYSNLGELEAHRQSAELAEESVATAAEHAGEAASELGKVQMRLVSRRTEQTQANDQLTAAAEQLRAFAAEAGIATSIEDVDDRSLADAAAAPLTARERAIDEVRRALAEHTRAVAKRDNASDQLATATDDLADANEVEDQARSDERDELAAWRGQLSDWHAGLTELDTETLKELSTVEDPARAAALVAGALADVREALAGARQRLVTLLDGLVAETGELTEERADQLAGALPRVVAPHWRTTRDTRPGAPLWQLVDFAEDLTTGDRDQLEASLLASGLLDAFVDADGGIELPDGTADTAFGAGEDLRPARTLADVLRPEDHDAVAHTTIEAALRRVAVVDTDAAAHPVAVGLDRSFRLGALTGRASAAPAELIGATAQAQARQRRIATIDQRLSELEALTSEVDHDLAVLTGRQQRADAEARSLPAATALEAARRGLARAVGRVEQATSSQAKWELRLSVTEKAVATALVGLNLLSTRYALPTGSDALDAVAEAARSARAAAGTCRERAGRLEGIDGLVTDLEEDLAQWSTAAAARAAEARTITNDAAARRGEYDALVASVGAEADKVRTDLEQLEREQKAVRLRRGTLRSETETAISVLTQAEGILARVLEDQRQANKEREAARTSFEAAIRSTLLDDAQIDGVTAPATLQWTAALILAREIGEELPRIDTSSASITRLRRTAGDRFHAAQAQLAGRIDLSYRNNADHDWDLLVAREDGTELGCAALRQLVDARLEQARRELSASEQRVFEQTLTGAVRKHLADRIRTARELVDGMNRVLSEVETSAGAVRVALRWDVDGDIADRDTLKRVLELLLSGHHSPEEAEELHRFLRDQIERIRAEDGGAGGWHERLTKILDYRSWHRFSVLVHHARFGEKPVAFGSRKVALSAGEKTVALTLPLLAAVAAHYMPRGGGDIPACPRLLLMDELFPKVDRANKRQLLGLLPLLDLDAVFTSDKDWCNYDTLDEIAIHVVQKDEDETSYTTRFVWNGAQQRSAPTPTPSSGPPLLAGLFDA